MRTPAAVPPTRRLRRYGGAVAAVGLSLLAVIAAGEALGWPFLVAPLQRLLSNRLERQLSLESDPQAAPGPAAKVYFVGGLRLETPKLEVAAPAWSSAPHLLRAREVRLALRYVDLWRAWGGQPLRIESLSANTLDAQLERLADRRVSWQFGVQPAAADAATRPVPLPTFGRLRVNSGTVHHVDAMLAIDAHFALSLVDPAATPLASGTSASGAAAAGTADASVLQVNARGSFRQQPIKLDLHAAGVMPWASDETQSVALPLRLQATVGRASLAFEGSAQDLLHLRGLSGQFRLSGPSLAAVGDPLGVTLPTTAAFRTAGEIVQEDKVWRVRIDQATVGASRLNGTFSYETGRGRPLLVGRLGGSRLLLADLGPVVGTTTAVAAATSAASAASAASAPMPLDAAKAVVVAVALPASTRGPGRVLPNRPFDLAALRTMDANVLIDLREVDLNTQRLEPLRPLRARLVLADGVLKLQEIDARAAQGRLRGELQLDGRGAAALWTSSLRWDAVQLERWIHQTRAGAKPAYVTGRLEGQATLAGQGRSTAEILASLSGTVRTELRAGAISHLAIEAAGLDLAQSLGLLIKGDAMLPVHCALADLVVERGVLRPRMMVIDTSDSTVWLDGTVSLASEQIELRAVVSPKDFSPLTLRTPLRVHGSLADPEISVSKGPMARKLAASFLLALVNPLAALIPLIDTGETGATRSTDRGAGGCQALRAKRDVAGRAGVEPGR